MLSPYCQMRDLSKKMRDLSKYISSPLRSFVAEKAEHAFRVVRIADFDFGHS
ncbi:hypothetical protein A343_2036 [Porphyromonas gingivalis JCVI SC001]|nr:hypothetical protein A343_2036 [Porphyromonas gingivalis JCVI SC001]